MRIINTINYEIYTKNKNEKLKESEKIRQTDKISSKKVRNESC